MEKYYFTFCGGDPIHHNHVQPISAPDYVSAREAMFEHYGEKWAFQYSEEQWLDWCSRRPIYFPVEIELPEIIYVGRDKCDD